VLFDADIEFPDVAKYALDTAPYRAERSCPWPEASSSEGGESWGGVCYALETSDEILKKKVSEVFIFQRRTAIPLK
jgi:hypothetical protein